MDAGGMSTATAHTTDARAAGHAAAPGGLKSRLVGVVHWAKASRKRAWLLIGGGGAFVVVAAVGAFALIGKKAEPEVKVVEPAVEAAEIFEALDRRAFSETRALCAKMLRINGEGEASRATVAFARGAVAAYEAQELIDPVKRRRRNLLAVRLLEEARDRGLPEGREAEGLYLLGRSLVLVDRNVAARGVLRDALKTALTENKTAITRLLARAYRSEPESDPALALQYNGEFLASPGLSDDERSAGSLQRAEILLTMGDIDACRDTLAGIDPNSAESAAASVVFGKVLMVEARKISDDRAPKKYFEAAQLSAVKLRQAIDAFSYAQLRDRLQEQPSRQAMVYVGECLARLGDLRAAADQFARTQALHPLRPEGFVARLLLADALQSLKEAETATAAYCEALIDAARPDSFPNPWFTRDDFRARIAGVYQSLIDKDEFASAASLAEKMPPLVDAGRAAQMGAEAHQRWARKLLTEAGTSAEGGEMRLQAAEQFRLAGEKYAQLAEIRFASAHYPQDIWQAAQNYFLGNDYAKAIELFRTFIDNETRIGNSQALVSIGESQLALGKVDAALKTFERCLELYPRDAACYRARLFAAKALLSKDKVDEAKAYLKENIDGRLTPASPEWRDSLFLLGELAYADGNRDEEQSAALDAQSKPADALEKLESAAAHYRRAANTLEEAVQRYPEAPQVVQARYHWAEALRRIAKYPRRKLRDANIEAIRLGLIKEIQSAVGESIQVYESLQNDLNRQQEKRQLGPLETIVQRNCYFILGDLYYEVGQYQEAIVAYKAASNRYQNVPEALHAFFQIAACHRRMNRSADARGALEQAKVILSRIVADDATFLAATSQTRAEWQKLLDWMSKQ
jgi:TolA-binding protein